MCSKEHTISKWANQLNKQFSKKRNTNGQYIKKCPAPVAHAYNPSYSRGRDQEDRGSKPAQENSLQDPISKNPIINKRVRGTVEWLKYRP
jgi:hypothetical protein